MVKHKILAVYDLHYPKHIPLQTLLDFSKDFKPTDFILGGDTWDLDIISHWNDANFKNIGFDNIRCRLWDEADQLKRLLMRFRLAMPKAKFWFIEGNHCLWLRGFSDKYPQMQDLSISTLLDFKSFKINLIPATPGKDFVKIGKLYFKHGHQYGTQYPAKQAVERSKKSVVIGHHHGRMEWGDYSDVDASDNHIGVLVPCYCKRDVEYGQGKPNKWCTGFFTACVSTTGNFSHHVQLVRSVDGSFISQMGKKY